MQVTLCEELIEAATIFWNEKRLIFKFGDVEMTLLLEKIQKYVEDKNVLSKKSWNTLEDIRDKLRLQNSMMVSYVMKYKILKSYLFDKFGQDHGRQAYEAESPDPK